MALPGHDLGADEAHRLRVEGFRRADIGDEQAHRADAGDLERPRQARSGNDVFLAGLVPDHVAGVDVDALGDGVAHFLFLGNLRQFRRLPEGAVVHRLGLRAAVPADLFHAVIEFDRMAVGIADVGVPVAARHVAPDPADLDVVLAEIVGRREHLVQRPDLPGDLVHRDITRDRVVPEDGAQRLVRQQEGMVVGIVAHEDDARILEALRHLLAARHLGEVARVGDPEPEETGVEVEPLVHVRDVEAEMPKTPDLERPRIANAADVVGRRSLNRVHGLLPFSSCGARRASRPWHCRGSIPERLTRPARRSCGCASP